MIPGGHITILDTNIVSELLRPELDENVALWADRASAGNFYTTSVTMAESFYGAHLMPQGKRKADLLHVLEHFYGKTLSGRILPFDTSAARTYALLLADRKKSGRSMPVADAMIAAIVRVHGGVLATRNIRDFDGCGIALIDPFAG